MEFTWDTEKDAANEAKHGVNFTQAKEMLQQGEVLSIPANTVGPETRTLSIGEIDGKTYSVVTTLRDGVTRIISFRRANDKERSIYEQAK